MAETIKQTAGREQLGNFAPQFAHINDDVLFGEVWNEKAIDLKTKCLVTVVALMSSGITDSSLRYHLQNAKSNGVTREEIAAVITHAAMYAGIPKGWAAFRLVKDIWKNDAAVSFEEIFASEDSKVRDMSELASAIIKDYYDPLLGEEQNDYMIEMFQSYTSIKNQLAAGKRYFFVKENGRNIGFNWSDEVMGLSDPMEDSYQYFVRIDDSEAAVAAYTFKAADKVKFKGAPAGETAFVTPAMTEREFAQTSKSFKTIKQCIRLLQD